MTTETKILPSEATHWYDKQGQPVYEVPKAKGDGMRPTTIADARKLGLVPSVTAIIGIAAKPGLQKWKLQQMLHAALTLPRLDGETDDAFAERVIEDSEAQSKKAMERGTELHAAIELAISTRQGDPQWQSHIYKLLDTLLEGYGIDLFTGKAEHSFASPLGYGGKLDWHNDEVLIDFKTKARIEDGKQLAWPEHCWQLAAYSTGLLKNVHLGVVHPRRLINVFIGVEDCQVRIHEWTHEDAEKGWQIFHHLLSVWKLTKNYNP
jgi:hypothetical protein